MKRLTIPDTPIEGGLRRSVVDVREVRKYAMTIYWQLKKYEDVGLTPDQIRQMDELYREKCEEVNRLKAELAAERQKHRWIPVEERLPEKEGRYLAVFRESRGISLLGYGNCQRDIFGKRIGFGWYELCTGNYFAENSIIAWKPLPEPYRPEKCHGCFGAANNDCERCMDEEWRRISGSDSWTGNRKRQ